MVCNWAASNNSEDRRDMGCLDNLVAKVGSCSVVAVGTTDSDTVASCHIVADTGSLVVDHCSSSTEVD